MASNSMMKALAKTHAGEGLELIEAPVPTPGPSDVLIRVKRTAICGIDKHHARTSRSICRRPVRSDHVVH